MDDILFSVDNGVATVTLNRPERKNAFTLEMVDRWRGILESVRRDPDVRVVVLTGAGDAFCSGVDLGLFETLTRTPFDLHLTLRDHMHRVALALEDFDKPVIAAVPGVAVGAGMDLALMCDMRFVAESARFSEGYIRLALVPGEGGCYYLPRLVGMPKALELLLSGDFVDAQEALRIGIANRLVPDDQLQSAVAAFARKLAGHAPVTMGLIKRAVYQSWRSDLRASLELTASQAAVAQATRDAVEAQRAFADGRAPAFEGR